MTALKCDACGAGLSMDKSGDFAICEYCGMKHTNERISVKIQEIKGVVEITKGDAEKKRLLKNAETFIELGKISSAREIYEQLTNDYPDEWMGWAGRAFMAMLRFPELLSSNEIVEILKSKLPLPYSEPYRGVSVCFEDYCSTAQKLAADKLQQYIEPKWEQHNTRHTTFISNLECDLANGNVCFNKISCCFGDGAYVPEKIKPILSQLKENADRVNKAIGNSKNKYENFDSLGEIKDFHFDYDGTKEIEQIALLSMREAVLLGDFRQGQYGSIAKSVTISFNQKYTIEQLIEELMKPTPKEQKILWINAGLCENCGSIIGENHLCQKCNHLNDNRKVMLAQKLLQLCRRFPDQVNLLEEIYTKFDYSGSPKPKDPDPHPAFHPRYQTYKDAKKHNLRHSARIKEIEMHDTCIIVLYSIHVEQKEVKKERLQIQKKELLEFINYLEKRTIKNVCQVCGGSFKGVFTKVCSDCGAKKDF